MTEKKFTIGQEVWVKDAGKYETGLKKRTVSKVGRKYVTLSSGKKYNVDTHQEVKDRGEEGYLYLSVQEYEDELELKKNKSEITSYFSFYSTDVITVEQTREILAILKGGTK